MKRRTLSKKKQVERLMGKCTFQKPSRFGPFTLVSALYLLNGEVIEGLGIARRSPVDPENMAIGETVARHRAVRSILHKLKGKQPSHPLMG